MAIASSRRRRNPEGRMALREHLVELRRRLTRAGLGVLAGAVGGWFLYEPLFVAATRPIREIQERRGAAAATINFGDPISPFNLKIQAALTIGLLISSPIWLYQLWAFITPGLTTKERRSSLGFLAAAVPLFLSGSLLAWFVLPKAIEFLNEFVPDGGSTFIDARSYFSFVTRVVLAFGIAFVVPVVLVCLNLVGLLKARTLIRHWRIIVFSCFLFAAIATPTPEATSMCVLAGAMCLLFAVAVLICVLVDRRRARRSAEGSHESLDDDEASPL
jgi:sec-independent protein translocase protein TatC